MSCANTGPFDGGVWNNPTVVDPTVSGGDFTGSTLEAVSLTKNVTVDQAVAEQLARQLCPYVAGCVTFDAAEVAAVFKDCNGREHVPDAQIPTCAEVAEAIETAIKPVVATSLPAVSAPADTVDLPTAIIGNARDQLLGKPDVYLTFGDYLVPAYFKV